MKHLQFVLFSVLMIGMVGCRSSKEVVERPTKKDREWLEELMQFKSLLEVFHHFDSIL